MILSRKILALVAAVTVCAGCSNSLSGDSGELLVLAAASLTNAFDQLETTFEAEHSDVDVQLSLASSSSLREQILEGAPADVFASANIPNMEQVVAAGSVIGDPAIFAQNLLQIAVPAGNPAGITSLADFGDPGLLIGLCAEDAPCGSFGRQALTNAGVAASIDTNEPDVIALLTKIEAGELDAGIVYVTDVLAAGNGVEAIVIPAEVNVVADYAIAVLTNGTNTDGGATFVDFVTSEVGQAILAAFGFQTP